MDQTTGAFDDDVELAAALGNLDESCPVPPGQPLSDQDRATFNGLADSARELAACIDRNGRSGLASGCTADLQRLATALETLVGPVKVVDTPLTARI